jgi:hypothetical protein
MKMIFKITCLLIFTGLTCFLTNCYSASAKTDKQQTILKNYFDSTGSVFVKLYKPTNDKVILYWETWNTNDKSAITHFGLLGDKGTIEKVNTFSSKELQDKINSLIDQKIKEGYAEIPIEKLYTVTINFKLKTWGTSKDLDRREFVRNIVTENLGWTGNGRCDDGDIGSGEMTLFADVVDPYIAIRTLTKEFLDKNINDEHIFGIMQGDKVITTDYKPSSK